MPQQHISALTSSGFTGDIILPTDEGWQESTRAWGAQAKRSPKVALKPKSAHDVSKAILWLNKFDIDFAARSGGMAESQSDGVILDLSYLNKIDYEENKKVIRLGPGRAWRDFYKEMEAKDITVLGGRVGYVGVGGFTLGGGLSYLANLHGLAADSLVDAQVVLADGSIVWAKDNEDLLFALKGAGHAYGVVTELVVKAYPKPSSVYGGFLIFTLDKYEQLCKHLCDLAANNKDPKVNAMLGLVRVPPDMHHLALLMPLVFGEPEFAKKALAWAWELGPVQDMSGPMPYEQAVYAQDTFVQRPSPGTTYQQNNVVVKHLTPAVMQAALDWQTALQKDNPRFYGAALLIEPFFPGTFASDDTKTAWPHASETLHVVEIFIEERDAQPGHAEENAGHLRACARALEAAAGEDAVLNKYPNYALAGTPAVEFYGKNLDRLRKIKKRLDPQNRFNKGINLVA